MINVNKRKVRLFYRKYLKRHVKVSPYVLIIIFLIFATFVSVRENLHKNEITEELKLNRELREREAKYLEKEIMKRNDETKHLQEQLEELKKQVSKPEHVRLSKKLFGADAVTFLAIIKSESGLNPKAVGYNCYYGNISKACKPEDRVNAWSVDCGISQINIAGKVCPEYAFDIKWNIEQAYKKYVNRGFKPWVVYNQNKHVKNIAWAKEQL